MLNLHKSKENRSLKHLKNDARKIVFRLLLGFQKRYLSKLSGIHSHGQWNVYYFIIYYYHIINNRSCSCMRCFTSNTGSCWLAKQWAAKQLFGKCWLKHWLVWLTKEQKHKRLKHKSNTNNQLWNFWKKMLLSNIKSNLFSINFNLFQRRWRTKCWVPSNKLQNHQSQIHYHDTTVWIVWSLHSWMVRWGIRWYISRNGDLNNARTEGV